MDRRFSKTEAAIQEAYFDLLSEKQGEKTTISEIARRANIDRKTFYLHYNSVNDLDRQICREKVNEMMDEISRAKFSSGQLPVIEFIFLLDQMAREDDKFIKYAFYEGQGFDYFFSLAKSELADETIRRFRFFFMGVPEDRLKNYVILFISGIIAIYIDWVRLGRPVPIERLAEIMNEAVMGGIRKSLPDGILE